MKFKRSTRPGGISANKETAAVNLKTIEKKPKKPLSEQSQKKKGVTFRLFDLEGKENHRQLPRRQFPTSEAAATHHQRRPDDVLSERMAQGLSLGSSAPDQAFNEARPIPKPVLSSFVGRQSYFKRSFSMRARSTTTQMTLTSSIGGAGGSAENVASSEIKTATIRRAFGKSLTSKRDAGLLITLSRFVGM